MIKLYYNLLAVPAEHCAGNVGFERITVPQICGTVPVYLGQKKTMRIQLYSCHQIGNYLAAPPGLKPKISSIKDPDKLIPGSKRA